MSGVRSDARVELHAGSSCFLSDTHSISRREQLAIHLAMSEGVGPEELVPNTLDEEPQDGMLACGVDGHFAWRDRLSRVDAQLRADRSRDPCRRPLQGGDGGGVTRLARTGTER